MVGFPGRVRTKISFCYESKIRTSEIQKSEFLKKFSERVDNSKHTSVRCPEKGVVPYELIVNDEGQEDLLKYWRQNENTFTILTKKARDVLNIQASSTASDSVFSAERFQIGEHIHSLAGDTLEITVLFRDWIRAERRRCGQPETSEEEDYNYNEILSEGAESDVEEFDKQIPIPTEDPQDIVRKFEKVWLNM
ncbi:hypothetical protein RND71_012141 [Anisodus tanguticus]|uniref:HAT C-terminal dimerisation domain-containing protein n=1 Tax=Anisodus tanguticus TaxID=243964 RepID=A0AAE1VPH5_9SOLA|nr:hypothetical protein RND71_012141 [Anisodus tanguticus]